MSWWKASKLGALGVLPLAAAALQQTQAPAVFHSGTRLVEVEVVVRRQPVRPPGFRASMAYFLDSGPPFGPPGDLIKGLTKDDFALFDEGKPQPISVFSVGPSGSPQGQTSVALPPGAVSNRQDIRGQPVSGATAVLVDFLNTDFGCLGYERQGMISLLRSLTDADSRIALYTLGENLHVLHDFTDDPQKLVETAAKLDQPHAKLPDDIAGAIRDYGDLLDLGRVVVHGQITEHALKLIIQHLSGMPGRKNLVWLMHQSSNVPPSVISMAQRANIVLYPVLVRLVGGELCVGGDLHGAQDLAAFTGGRAFLDSKDLTAAVRTVQEDSASTYVLGYYPDEDMLDGKYHKLTVKLRHKAPEVDYRPGYLATKVPAPTPALPLADLFEGRIDATGIGLAAQATPEPEHPGLFDVRVVMDLHDIHLERKDDHFTGAFDLSVPDPSTKGTIRTGTFALNLTDQELTEALEIGLAVNLAGARSDGGEIRVVVRDRSTGVAGSLRIPVAKE